MRPRGYSTHRFLPRALTGGGFSCRTLHFCRDAISTPSATRRSEHLRSLGLSEYESLPFFPNRLRWEEKPREVLVQTLPVALALTAGCHSPAFLRPAWRRSGRPRGNRLHPCGNPLLRPSS